MSLDKKLQKDLNFTKPVFLIKINDQQISTDRIESIYIDFDVEKLVPKAQIVILDLSGNSLNSAEINLGTKVNISIVEQDNGILKEFKFEDFYVQNFDATFPFDDVETYLANRMVLDLAYEWEIKQDYSSHAYPAEIASKTVLRTLKNSTRGFQISYDKKDVVTTTDLGLKPRYKYGLGDKDFIEQKLLPLCRNGEEACYCFLNESGWFYLTTYAAMMGNDSECCLVTDMSEFSKSEIENMGKFKSVKNFTIQNFASLKDYYKHIASAFVVASEAEKKNRILKVGQRAITQDSYEHYLPIDPNYHTEMKEFISTKTYVEHMDMDDFFSRDLFSRRDENKALKVVGLCSFTNMISLGYPVSLATTAKDKQIGSLSRNYVVSRIRYYSKGTSLSANMQLELTASNYILKDKETSLLDTTCLKKV